MRDLAVRLDLCPPYSAMAEADAIRVERFRNDHVIDARLRKTPLRRKVGDAPEASRLLVDRAGYFYGPGETLVEIEVGFRRDNRGRETALHVATAATVDTA